MLPKPDFHQTKKYWHTTNIVVGIKTQKNQFKTYCDNDKIPFKMRTF